jgi:hypothetical protein
MNAQGSEQAATFDLQCRVTDSVGISIFGVVLSPSIAYNAQAKEITRRGLYWALAHYSRVIRRGARRFDWQSAAADLQHVGLENPDGRQALVVTNAAPARAIESHLANRAARVPLKKNSVAQYCGGINVNAAWRLLRASRHVVLEGGRWL